MALFLCLTQDRIKAGSINIGLIRPALLRPCAKCLNKNILLLLISNLI